jgi:hypothetical protein
MATDENTISLGTQAGALGPALTAAQPALIVGFGLYLQPGQNRGP